MNKWQVMVVRPSQRQDRPAIWSGPRLAPPRKWTEHQRTPSLGARGPGAGGRGGNPDMGAVLWFIKSSANLNVWAREKLRCWDPIVATCAPALVFVDCWILGRARGHDPWLALGANLKYIKEIPNNRPVECIPCSIWSSSVFRCLKVFQPFEKIRVLNTHFTMSCFSLAHFALHVEFHQAMDYCVIKKTPIVIDVMNRLKMGVRRFQRITCFKPKLIVSRLQ